MDPETNQPETSRNASGGVSVDTLMLALEQTSDVIFITNTGGQILYVNPAFETATGYRRDEAIGQNPRFLKSGHQDADHYQKMWASLTVGHPWKGRFVNRRKDGTLYTVDTSISPVRDAAGHITHYVAVSRDVSGDLAREEEKRRLEAQLAQAQRLESVGRLAGGIAHDFNNTLQVIMGHAEFLQPAAEKNPDNRDALEEIMRAASRSAGIIRQLMAFARRQSVQPRNIDLNEVVGGMHNMLRHLLGEDIELVWRLHPASLAVKLDPSQVDQVLVNLVVNARDAIGGNGRLVVETREETVGTDPDDPFAASVSPGRYAALVVGDNGCGISDEALPHIFEPFFTTKGPERGTGLGLATVYGIVKQAAGHISVASIVGQGTIFTILFPLSGAIDPVVEKPAPVGTGRETILVVEDEWSIAAPIQLFLEKAGYRVLAATAPREAIRIVSETKDSIDLILTDVIMPVMNGHELVEHVTSIRPGIRPVFMSGYTSDVMISRDRVGAGPAFISKPFSQADLLKLIREVLDGRTA